jgi:hypothetical protein
MVAEKKDFVNVQLTEFGVKFAEGSTLQVHEGQHSFYFKAGEIKLVTRAFDWNRVLKNQHINGHALFEIVPDQEAENVEMLQKIGVEASAGHDEIDVKTKEVTA